MRLRLQCPCDRRVLQNDCASKNLNIVGVFLSTCVRLFFNFWSTVCQLFANFFLTKVEAKNDQPAEGTTTTCRGNQLPEIIWEPGPVMFEFYSTIVRFFLDYCSTLGRQFFRLWSKKNAKNRANIEQKSMWSSSRMSNFGRKKIEKKLSKTRTKLEQTSRNRLDNFFVFFSTFVRFFFDFCSTFFGEMSMCSRPKFFLWKKNPRENLSVQTLFGSYF